MESAPASGDGPLLAELKWVHGRIRDDLAAVRDLSARVLGGEPAPEVRAGVQGLKTGGTLWRLRTNCLTHCRFVHSHHGAEDAGLFPALRAGDPGLGPVIDKLEADHRVVSKLLDEIEASATGPLESETVARQRLSDALDELHRHLLEHLAFEEEAIGPTLNTWTEWPRP